MSLVVNKVIIDRLYDYQLESIEKTKDYNKGIVCLPTGTGKTYIQAAIIANDIINNNGKFGIYVINAPRILLSYQLLKEVYAFLSITNIDAKYMSVHSGGPMDMEDLECIRHKSNLSNNVNLKYSDVVSSTSSYLIKETAKKAYQLDLPMIYFSTYNSAIRINEAIPNIKINIVVNDEAQYLVQERFHDIIKTLNFIKCYFFTATTIHTLSCTGMGMNNDKSYGKLLYYMSPRIAIDKGKMVRPRMHILKTSSMYKREDYDRSLNKIISEAFVHHKFILKKQSAKLLVSCKGTNDIKRFLSSAEYINVINRGIDVYAISSDDSIGNNINGQKTSRHDFLNRLSIAGNDPKKELIVLHYDILTEGINICGFTGFMPLRTLYKSKFCQTYGRVARLDPIDRELINSCIIKPNELNKMNKPYAYIVVPEILCEDSDGLQYVKSMLNELRSYGFNPHEDIISTDIINGIPEIDEPETLNDIKKSSIILGELIEYIESIYEDENICNLEIFENDGTSSLTGINLVRDFITNE